ncbi:unnamed protein product, partial [marine sediment metagenome]
IDEPATATRVLAEWEATALTGGFPGRIAWIAGNSNHMGHFYVLWCSNLSGTGVWVLKTTDLGETWTAHQLYDRPYSYDVGNIQAGTAQGESPYPPGDVIYACLNLGAGGALWLARSLDEGETWATIPTPPHGVSTWQPRLYVDPADQAQFFTGGDTGGPNLYRTWNHGATWFLADAGNALGINVDPPGLYGTMGTAPSNPDAIRVLKNSHIWKTSDNGLIWRDQGPTQYELPHLRFRDGSYDYLYLARIYNAPGTGGIYTHHVLL